MSRTPRFGAAASFVRRGHEAGVEAAPDETRRGAKTRRVACRQRPVQRHRKTQLVGIDALHPVVELRQLGGQARVDFDQLERAGLRLDEKLEVEKPVVQAIAAHDALGRFAHALLQRRVAAAREDEALK